MTGTTSLHESCHSPPPWGCSHARESCHFPNEMQFCKIEYYFLKYYALCITLSPQTGPGSGGEEEFATTCWARLPPWAHPPPPKEPLLVAGVEEEIVLISHLLEATLNPSSCKPGKAVPSPSNLEKNNNLKV